MIITRIQVEEGFLDGLDLRFAAGLNVLIGPRGTGKTSIIELLRFALGSPSLTDTVGQSAREHALSVLGSGSVAVTVNDGSDNFTLKRSADNWSTNGPKAFSHPVILSQNEIESVGLHALGRLRLIDSIRAIASVPDGRQESALLSYVRSHTEERRTLTSELQAIRQQIRDLTEQLKDANVLKKQHAEALAGIAKAKTQTERLAKLDRWLANLSVRSDVFSRLDASLQQRLVRLQNFGTSILSVESWPTSAAGEDPLTKVRASVAAGQASIEEAVRHVRVAIEEVRVLAKANEQQTHEFDEESRGLRRQLDALQQGAGDAARKLAIIQEKTGQLSALRDLENEVTPVLWTEGADQPKRNRYPCQRQNHPTAQSSNARCSPIRRALANPRRR